MQIIWIVRTLAGVAVTCFSGHPAARQAADWVARHPGHMAVRMVL
jgi:hypothetical protein